MNEQRKVIYKIRRDILNDEANKELLSDFVEEVSFDLAEQHKPDKKSSLREFPWADINASVRALFNIDKTLTPEECDSKAQSDLAEYIKLVGSEAVESKFASFDPEQVKYTHREVLLAPFDQVWTDPLLAMDHL
jgi:preprotein translocase subunit SecA